MVRPRTMPNWLQDAALLGLGGLVGYLGHLFLAKIGTRDTSADSRVTPPTRSSADPAD